MAENNVQSPAKETKTEKAPFSKNLKAEFAKIVWPGRDELTRQTIAVVCISIAMGVIISLIDLILGYGINLITK